MKFEDYNKGRFALELQNYMKYCEKKEYDLLKFHFEEFAKQSNSDRAVVSHKQKFSKVNGKDFCEWKPVTDTELNKIGNTTDCTSNNRNKLIKYDYMYCPYCGNKVTRA